MALKISDIDRAIGSHGLWKGCLRTAIEYGKSDVSVDAVARTDRCDFGKWLHGPALSAQDKASEQYTKVKDLHARFHKAAAAAIGLALAGKKAAAERILDVNGEFTAASAELTTAMLEWRVSLGRRKS